MTLSEKFLTLRDEWDLVWRTLTEPTDTTYEPKACALRERLLYAYGEPRRRYHTINHLYFVVTAIRQQANYAPSGWLFRPRLPIPPREVARAMMAAFYHDAIYDMRPEAEQRCAEMMSIDLSPSPVPLTDIQAIAAAIRGTASLQVNPRAGLAEKLLHDADCAILSAPPEIYRKYADQILAEYGYDKNKPSGLQSLRVLRGRRQFLERAIGSIQYSEYRPENITVEQARSNMYQEVRDRA